MGTETAKLLVLVGEHFACVKIVGRANFSSSVEFKTLLTELQAEGFSYFVLDLSECQLMDSTFLGVLAAFGLRMSRGQDGQNRPAIELMNPNPRMTELLESVGILHLFKLNQDTLYLPQATQTRAFTCATPSKVDAARACLEAHQTLMEISPGNVSRFKDVTTYLAENLKRLESGVAGR
jgi:anti-sigma B factor antagonist